MAEEPSPSPALFTYYRNEDETYQPTLTTGIETRLSTLTTVIHLMGLSKVKERFRQLRALLIDNDSEVPIDLHFRVPERPTKRV